LPYFEYITKNIIKKSKGGIPVPPLRWESLSRGVNLIHTPGVYNYYAFDRINLWPRE